MEKKHLRQFSSGEKFSGIAVLQKIVLKEKKDGNPYLSLFICDAGGRVPAKIWQNSKKLSLELQAQMIVKVSGTFHLYKSRTELHIQKIRLARKSEIDLNHLIPKSSKKPDELIKKVTDHISDISDEFIILLLRKVFPAKSDLYNFLQAPSGKLWHHNYIYGTLESVLLMLDIADTIKIHYPRANINLIKAGIILRAFCKHSGINTENFIEYSTERRLMGHYFLGSSQIVKFMEELEDFPQNLRMELIHIMLCDDENGESGVLPMTFEANILVQLEKLDTKMNALLRIIENDRIPGSNWTRYNNLLNRFIYISNKTDGDQSHKEDKQLDLSQENK